MATTPQARAQQLAHHVAQQGTLLAALRAWTGESTRAMCKRLGLRRSSVQVMGAGTYGRREEPTRRAIEAALGLPPYTLDEHLP